VTKLPTVALATVISVLSNPVTSSLNVAVTLNKPFTVVVDADVKTTVGATVSITMALLPPRELAVAVAGRVNTASSVKLSLMVPPLRVRAVVARYSKSPEVSPACTT
jgi:hypothetical protein